MGDFAKVIIAFFLFLLVARSCDIAGNVVRSGEYTLAAPTGTQFSIKVTRYADTLCGLSVDGGVFGRHCDMTLEEYVRLNGGG